VRLASQAPLGHIGDLIDLAHSTWHDELALHRDLAAEFGARLETARKGPACEAYTSFLLDACADYGHGIAALFPCMWGYSTLGRMLARDTPAEPRYARWVATYSDEGFAALARRCGEMLDEVHRDGLVDEATAIEAFDTSLSYELAFWDVP
jgi:thiaminase/transcriptional activator TenA